MNGDVVDFLMSQKNGANYVVLYQMLCMKTINTQGELATKIGDVLIPFNIDKIQRECKWFDVDTIRVAMEMYRQLGLLYEQENGIIKISNFQEMVGSETYWAKQKRIERNEQKELLNSGFGQKLENVQKPLISKSNNLLSNNKEYNNFSDRIKEGIQTWITYKREKGQTKANGSMLPHYNTMELEEIKKLPIQNICEEKCILFLWVTFPTIEQAFEVIKAWGFTYKTCAFCWVKQNPKSDGIYSGMGHWTNQNAELCLLATKKKFPKRIARNVKQIVLAHRQNHSKKPDSIRDDIERLVGDLPRIELFARQHADGWDCWGNEV